MSDSARYLIEKRGPRGGMPRYFWQPSRQLVAQGWRVQRVPKNWAAITSKAALHEAAVEAAERLNAQVDEQRPTPSTRPLFNSPRYLYVLHRGDGMRKIGITTKPLNRQRALQSVTGSELHLEMLLWWAAPAALENRVHQLLRTHRAKGEWFLSSWDEVFAALSTALAEWRAKV